jgi:hypothetical protein
MKEKLYPEFEPFRWRTKNKIAITTSITITRRLSLLFLYPAWNAFEYASYEQQSNVEELSL